MFRYFNWMVEKDQLRSGQHFGELSLTRPSTRQADEEGTVIPRHQETIVAL